MNAITVTTKEKDLHGFSTREEHLEYLLREVINLKILNRSKVINHIITQDYLLAREIQEELHIVI